MKNYTFELKEYLKELSVDVTPFGKTKYKYLPMDLKFTPDFDQQVMEQVMEQVLHNLENIGVYLYYISASSNIW